MLHDTIANALNEQIELEGQSSHVYLTMAVWAETQGFDGVAEFLYLHSEEERQHMLKLMRFVNARGGVAKVPTVAAGPTEYTGLKEIFESILEHETRVTECINNVVDLSPRAVIAIEAELEGKGSGGRLVEGAEHAGEVGEAAGEADAIERR